MNCPYCGMKTRVVETRRNGDRRRQCVNPLCPHLRQYGARHRFTTAEVKKVAPPIGIYADSFPKSTSSL